MIKNGTRLASQVCDTQVIVVRSTDSLDDLRCGGVPMVPIGGEAPVAAMGTYWNEKRAFSKHDIEAVESLGAAVSEAMQRIAA